MWYNNKGVGTLGELEYSKPIAAKSLDGVVFLLLPQISRSSGYSVVGYNWFNPECGTYNSQVFWETPQEAVKNYQQMDYIIENVTVCLLTKF
jgi:hypothetical protein